MQTRVGTSLGLPSPGNRLRPPERPVPLSAGPFFTYTRGSRYLTMDEAKRTYLYLSMHGLAASSEEVLLAIVALRDEKVDAEFREVLGTMESLLRDFTRELAALTMPPAVGELTRLAPNLTPSGARTVIPLLEALVKELRANAGAN